jgi:hypothetical protein
MSEGKKKKPVPQYSMRQPWKFEKGDFCPECNRSAISGNREGRIFCTQPTCGWEGHIRESFTNDYEQINFKLMAIIYKGS